ncbi:MAG: cytochrome c oxidase subunit [Humisphaera sp.]|nr:cytochrome c oxidase subunit [Humisphaera sp.]
MIARRVLIFALALLAVGCTGEQAALNPAGAQSGRITSLWWLICWTCVAVYVLTIGAIVIGVVRKRRRADEPDTPAPPTTRPDPAREHRTRIIVAAAVGVTVVILFVFMFSDFTTGRALASLAGDKSALTIKITGHQWWWEARYEDSTTSNTFTTANEIHIPVGRTIEFQLESADVIHSFWVPRLHGKKDMIPGHSTRTYLKADKPGVYYGQCAEFCGHQHANMRLVVIAQPHEEFESWRTAQIRPAGEPPFENLKRGRDVFLKNSCVMCHTIRGTTAGGRLGPDLTHVGSRKLLASNIIPNKPGHLAGWILDPQKIKPGVRMPQNALDPHDLRALLEFLESLK